MIVVPAIDIRDGRAVRLHQGDYARETVFDADPVDAARRWLDQGARRLHVVDLDGARDGRPAHLDLVARIAVAAGDVPVQVGGGLRTQADVTATLSAGASYAIVGTAALEDPDLLAALCDERPGRVWVGVDARDGRVAVRGWMETSEATATEVARRAVALGAAGIVHTDIARDGVGDGPNLAATGALADVCAAPVMASGGVGGVEHVRAAAADGRFFGMVVGRALYDGRMTLAEAMAAC